MEIEQGEQILSILFDIQKSMRSMEADITSIKADLTAIREDMSSIKANLSTIRGDMSSIKATVIRIDCKIDEQSKKLDILIEGQKQLLEMAK